jgi:type I restriction enzyme S subunit
LITEHLALWTGAVTKKSSSGRGSNGKVELTGIKKLRELILQLAVMGRLVEQAPADTSPKVLLNKISAERKKLAESEKVRLPKLQSILSTQDAKPFLIPTRWYWTKLEDLFAVVTDGDHQAPPKSEKGIPFLVIGNLNAGQVNFGGCKHVTETYYEKLDWARKPTSGDILYTVTGSYGIPIKVDTDKAFCVQRHVAILRATDSTPSDFVRLLLASAFGQAYADSIATGIAQKTVPLTGLRKMPIPLPPAQEQHRIVQKVDELMALCDQLEQQTSDQLEAHETLVDTLLSTLTQSANATELADNWARLAAHFDTLFTTEQSIEKLKQTVMQLAVMGRLVEQNAEDETAKALVEAIESQKLELTKTGAIKPSKTLPPVTEGEKPFPLPSGWACHRLGGLVAKLGSGSTPRGGQKAYVHQGVPFLRSQNIWNDGLRLDDIAYISEETHGRMSNTIVYPKDILLNITGASLGRSVIFPESIPEANVSQHVTIVRLIEPEMTPFVHLCIQSPLIQRLVWGRQVGMAIEGLSKKVLERFEMPVPPLNEQKRIVQKVDELMALCGQLKERLRRASETRCQLAEAVVEKSLI